VRRGQPVAVHDFAARGGGGEIVPGGAAGLWRARAIHHDVVGRRRRLVPRRLRIGLCRVHRLARGLVVAVYGLALLWKARLRRLGLRVRRSEMLEEGGVAREKMRTAPAAASEARISSGSELLRRRTLLSEKISRDEAALAKLAAISKSLAGLMRELRS